MAFRYPPSPPLTADEVEMMYRALVAEHRILPVNQGIIDGFVEEICSLLPPDNAAKIRSVFDKHQQTSKGKLDVAPLMDRVCNQLEPAGAGPVIRRHAIRAKTEVFRIAQEMQQALAGAESGIRVVFIATKPYFQVLREARALRENGVSCGLLCLDPIAPAMRSGFEDAFDSIIDGVRNPTVMAELVANLDVEIFHVQCWMWSYYLARLTIERKRKARVVCEVYDFTSVYAPRDILVRNWQREIVDTDIAMEQYLCTRSDAVVHRYHPDIDDELRERHGGLVRTLYTQPWPLPGVTPVNPPKLSDEDGILRMVYAGGVLEHDATPPELFPIRTMPRTFRSFLEQGFHIDLLHDPHRPIDATEGTRVYRELAEEFPGFRILDGVPPDRLPETLSAYDFGVVVTHIDRDVLKVGPGLMRGAVGTKLFGYIEAGIPSIVCKEYEYTAWFVENFGLGVALATEELESCGDKLRALDRKQIAENILAFNRDHNMSAEIAGLLDLYRDLLGKPA
jgi:hypothetical protein